MERVAGTVAGYTDEPIVREPIMVSRRHLSPQVLGALAVGLCLLASRADAQGFPSGTVRIIVPFPPGGATDVLGRVVAHELQVLWGQSVVAEYKPGASGLLGSRQVASAPADGCKPERGCQLSH